MRPIAVAFLLLGIAVSTGAAPVRAATVADQTELRMAPDPAKRREALGRLIANQRELPFRCPEIPEPVMALQLQPFYRADDPSQSTIDKERLEAYRVESLRAFTEGTNALADYYVGTKPRDGRIASCWADWVERWADKGALLANPATAQGNAERKWMLASIALNYALVADASEIEPARREKIESWIGRLARAWLEAPDYGFDSPNNHVNWGALALMAAGAAVNDRTFFDKGVELARLGLAQIDADGSAPLELRRGDRGITYQIFALEPLVVAAEIGLANGIQSLRGARRRPASPRIVHPRCHAQPANRRAADRRRAVLGREREDTSPLRLSGAGRRLTTRAFTTRPCATFCGRCADTISPSSGSATWRFGLANG